MPYSSNMFVGNRCLLWASTSLRSHRRGYNMRRALMYVPGNDDRKISKIPSLGADCICLDCEDGVSDNMKEAARNNIRQKLDEGSIDFGRSECTVRVNSAASVGLCEEDVRVIMNAKNLPHAVHLPKVDEVDHLKWFAHAFDNAVSGRKLEQPLGLIIFIESARALISLVDICKTAMEISRNVPLVPEALVFGSDDYVADIGATRTNDATELLYARQKLVTVAKAFQLQAIDLVHIDYKDLEGLKIESKKGARMGFTGKQVIHPGQIPVVHDAFAPSPKKVEWAEELIKEFHEHSLGGKGAIDFRGHMIDMPLVKQAQNILEMNEKLKKRK